MKKIRKIPDTELEIMRAVWALGGEVSTNQIREFLEKERPWCVGALQTMLSRLERREFLKSHADGRKKIFSPLVSERDYIAAVSGSLISRLTRSTVTQLVAALYESKTITESDLDELESFIEEKRRERSN